MAAGLLELPTDEAHLWLVDPDAASDPGVCAAYERLLNPAERARRARFHFAEHRHEYLVTRALVRTGLSRYAPVRPEAWEFSANAYGKPAVAGPPGAPRVEFNVSHTRGAIALLVARDRAVGVDVEDAARGGQTVEIAERFFAPAEVRALAALPAAAQRARFFRYWTLKEAYIKARGMGLAIPLEQFAFALDDPRPPRVALDPRLGDDPDAWQFAQWDWGARHALATAVRVAPGGGDAVRLVVRTVVPEVG